MGRDVERAESEEDLEKKRKEEEEELKAAKKRQVNKRGTLETNESKGTTKARKGTPKNLNCPGDFGQHRGPGGCHHYGLIGPCHSQL